MRLRRTSTLALLVLISATRWTDAQERFFDSEGIAIRYIEQGHGVPVVLVHGGASTLDSMWVETGLVEGLAKDFRAIALDCRGYGGSDKPHDPGAYGPEMGRDILRLLDHLQIDRAHIIGYSMGARIVAQLLTVAPDRFLTATLGGAAGRFDWSPEYEARVEREARDIEAGFLRSIALRIAPPDEPSPTDDEIRDWSAQILEGIDRYAMAAVWRGRLNQRVHLEDLSSVTVPTLGIVGDKDSNLADLETLEERMPALRLVVVEGETHNEGILNLVEIGE